MNPELRRYAWLDLGWHRVVAAPLVLGVLAAMALVSADKPAEVLAYGALGIFVAVTIGWGAMRANASVAEEVNERTWDAQRLAAFKPAALALGKVFGAPIFSWYIGAWCLAVYAVAGLAARLPHVASTVVGITALAVLVHALGVGASALGARAMLGARTRRTGGILMLIFLFNAMPMALMLGWDGGDGGELATVRWWGVSLSLRAFVALSTVLFALWTLLGAWRAMARELREPAWWWAWPAFAGFSALWWAGLSTPTQDRASLATTLAVASVILSVASYLGASLDPLTRVSWARLRRAWLEARLPWHRRLPGWAIHATLALLAGAAALLLSPAWRQAPASYADDWLQLGLGPLGALPIALMAIRDAAVVSCFALASGIRKPLALAAFYIAVADLLLPALFGAMGLDWLARACFPLWGFTQHPMYPSLGMSVHAAIALAALWTRVDILRRE